MTSLLTSPLASAQVPVRPSGTRAHAGGGDGTSAAAGGFDEVVVGYAAASKPPQTQREPASSDQKHGADTHDTTVASDQVAKTGLALKRTRADALRRHPTSPTAAEAPASLAAVNPAGHSAAEVKSSSATGAPAGPAVVPVLAGSVSPDTASAAIAAPVPASNLPGAVRESAMSPSEAGTMTGNTVPEASKVGLLAQGQPVVVESISAQPQEDASARGAVGAPTTTDPQITTGDSSAVGGVLPAPATSAGPKTPPTASGRPVVAPGAGGSETKVSVTAAHGDATPGQAGREANRIASVSSAHAVVVAPAADPALQGIAEATAVVNGAPAAPVTGVVPVISSPVPPPTAWAASASPTTGQPTPFLLPEAPHVQVFTAVSPLLRGADGSYGIHLQLHPRDLGAVQVTVDMHHGEISIQINAPDAATRDALRGGLSDLRQQLENQGLRSGSMEVGSGGANAQQPQTPWSGPPDIETPSLPTIPSDPLVATAGTASSTNLDLRM